MKSAIRELRQLVLAGAFATAAVLCCIHLVASLPAWFTSLRDELRLVSASTLEARQRPARDGSITLESWACPEIESFADALRPAVPHAGFMGLRLAYVRGSNPASTLEGSRILMAALFPAAFCAPVPLQLLQAGLRNASDPSLAALGTRIGDTEVFLVDGIDSAEVQVLLSQQPQPAGAERMVLVRSIGPRQHLVASTALVQKARAGDPTHSDLKALLP